LRQASRSQTPGRGYAPRFAMLARVARLSWLTTCGLPSRRMPPADAKLPRRRFRAAASVNDARVRQTGRNLRKGSTRPCSQASSRLCRSKSLLWVPQRYARLRPSLYCEGSCRLGFAGSPETTMRARGGAGWMKSRVLQLQSGLGACATQAVTFWSL